MIIHIEYNNKKFIIDTDNYADISIPFDFKGNQPNFYNVNKASIEYLKIDKKVLSVKSGSNINVHNIEMNIHCNGTHTECISHILDNDRSIYSCINNIFIPAELISIKPKLFNKTNDSYHVNVNNDEYVIDSKSINSFNIENIQSMIIRTMPNKISKKYYNYSKNTAPFLTNDAIDLIKSINVEHLVVDLPSIDKKDDNGILGNHRIFWGKDTNLDNLNCNSKKTITELAYISNEIKDGFYFLSIQIPRFKLDAAPSRCLLYRPIQVKH